LLECLQSPPGVSKGEHTFYLVSALAWMLADYAELRRNPNGFAMVVIANFASRCHDPSSGAALSVPHALAGFPHRIEVTRRPGAVC